MPELLKLLRPKQWVKNAFVLAPLFFSLQFDNINRLSLALLACLVFIASSSIIYIINDINDAQEDRKHPRKKHRPIASGHVSVTAALWLLVPLGTIVALGLLLLPVTCTFIICGYVIVNLLYSRILKHIAIIDVLVIASGFVLRLLMGGYAIGVQLSSWIIASTFLLALFIGFGKRHQELSVSGYQDVRESLRGYNLELLNRFITISCTSALLCYTLYTVETGRILGKPSLVYTTVFVVFGLFRYLQRIYLDKEGGEPETIILYDPLFISNGILWLLSVWWVLSHG